MDFIKRHQGWFVFFLFTAIMLLLFFEFPLGVNLDLIHNPFFFSLQKYTVPAANLNMALLGGTAGVLSVKAGITLVSSLIRHRHATATIHPNANDDGIIEVARDRRSSPGKILINFIKENEGWIAYFTYSSISTTLFLKLPYEALMPLVPFYLYVGPLALPAASFSLSTMGGLLGVGAFRLGMYIMKECTRTQGPRQHAHALDDAPRENRRASPGPSVASSVTISQQLPPSHPAGASLRIRASIVRRADGGEEPSPGVRSPSPVGLSLDSPRTRANEYSGLFLRRQGSAVILGEQDTEEAKSPVGRGGAWTRSSPYTTSPIGVRVAP